MGCSSVIETEPGHYFVVLETAQHKAGTLNLAGGGWDEQEMIKQCRSRETEEESGGLKTRPIGIAGIYEYFDERNRHRLQFHFVSEVVSGSLDELTPSEEHPWAGSLPFEQIEDIYENGGLRSWRVFESIRRCHEGRVGDLGLLMTGSSPPAMPMLGEVPALGDRTNGSQDLIELAVR